MNVQIIPIPAPGITSFTFLPGQALQFDFDTQNVDFARSDNDLTISQPDGGQIIISDFFEIAEGGNLPMVILADGTMLEGDAFLFGINPDMDLSPAAGPETSTMDSSGSGAYTDGSGELVGGVDSLESLGRDQWSNTTESGLVSSLAGLSGADDEIGSPPPPPPSAAGS